jgi:hypothetical protein
MNSRIDDSIEDLLAATAAEAEAASTGPGTVPGPVSARDPTPKKETSPEDEQMAQNRAKRKRGSEDEPYVFSLPILHPCLSELLGEPRNAPDPPRQRPSKRTGH